MDGHLILEGELINAGDANSVDVGFMSRQVRRSIKIIKKIKK
jgi:hypothetical protein